MEYLYLTWIVIKFILVALIAFFVFEQLFTTLFLIIDILNRKDRDQTEKFNFILLIKNALIEAFYVLGKIYLTPIRHKDLTVNKDKLATASRVIVLVHGYARSKADWWWFKEQLTDQYPVLMFNLKPKFGSIFDIAQNLNIEINNALQNNSEAKISLIGHSMGGLVAAQYALNHIDKVDSVVTLGSPWHGTKLAVMAKGINMRQIQLNSEFLIGLRNSITSLQGKLFCIASKTDNLIFPWSSALLPDELIKERTIFDYTTHLGLLYSKQVLNQIKEYLHL